MSEQKYTPPEYEVTAFNCPYCGAYASQVWTRTQAIPGNGRIFDTDSLDLAFCSHCNKYTIWLDATLIYPDTSQVESSNEDLNDDIKQDYEEAASILQKSPRGAAALLRLAVQKLCAQLGESGQDINQDIKNLVAQGLPPRVQESLDSLRVIGNESVHPGQIDLRDTPETAKSLFRLINFIAEKMITEPSEIQEIYDSIPPEKHDQINQRDNAGN